jgi:hypothetical protein
VIPAIKSGKFLKSKRTNRKMLGFISRAWAEAAQILV